MSTKHILRASLVLLMIAFVIPSVVSGPKYYHPKEHKEVKTTKKLPFQEGELLRYVIHYGWINAGIAELSIKENSKKKNKEVMNMVGKGWTTGATDWFFTVDDHYETYMDLETLESLRFIRRVNEGGFIINQDYFFDPDSNQVVTQDSASFEVPDGVQDMLSAFYYARSLDYEGAKVNDTYVIPAFVDNKIEMLRIKYKGKERIKTRMGEFDCIKFNPLVLEGRVFKEEEDVSVWISDDANKIPILIQSKIVVGSIKAELSFHQNLQYPLAQRN